MAHIDRTMCHTCGTWYWTGDTHTCPPSPNTNVLAAAFPAHGREVTALADARADRVIEAYQARISGENAYWADLCGLVLPGRAAA